MGCGEKAGGGYGQVFRVRAGVKGVGTAWTGVRYRCFG